MLVAGGSLNVTTYFAMRLTADGTAATGLTITGFDLQYVRSGVAPVAKVDATALAATDSAHGDNQAIEIDATDQPGLYRVDWPDAAFAAGVRETILSVKAATAFTEHLRCEIDGEVTAEALGTQAKADVNAEADTAISDASLATSAALATVDGNVDAILLDTAEIGTAGVGLSNISLPATGLDAVLKTSTYALAVADAIWDEVLTGGTHNVTNSAGRRLRQIQEAGSYSGGNVFIDTVNGAAGTTDFENGVDVNPVDSIALRKSALPVSASATSACPPPVSMRS